MALGGTYQDHYKDMFKDTLLLEAQQRGSRLSIIPMMEQVEGDKVYFDKLGKTNSAVKSGRGEAKNYTDLSFERRFFSEELNNFDTLFDKEDLIKYASNPQSSVVRSAVNEMGRVRDRIIMDAIKGSPLVQTDGSTAAQALTETIAVNDHTYDSGSGDVALTPSKLKLAVGTIEENYGDTTELFCIAPAKQIMALTQENEIISKDFRMGTPLEGPGVVKGVSGFLGITFIAYEETGVDSNSDELVYVLNKDAIKMGIFEPLNVEIRQDTSLKTNPDTLSVYEACGAVRMYEDFVVQIACDPIA